jgi:isoquinoline 1-oxidoreductase beta subunit
MANNLKRRDFLKMSGVAGPGLIMGIHLVNSTKTSAALVPETKYFEPSAFLKIGADNTISIVAKNPEIGQGVKTALPQIIAEELEVDWNKIEIVQANFDVRLGDQFAGGSTAIKENFTELRKVGASAREMLIEAASRKWQVSLDQCYAQSGYVFDRKSSKKLSYGELAEAASKLNIRENPALKNPKDFKIIGKAIGGVDNKKIVTGQIDFGIDVRPENAWVAVVLRCPVRGGKLKSFDATEAMKVPGVEQVIDFDYNPMDVLDQVNGVAVLATNTWAAIKARKLVKVEWDFMGGELESTDKITKTFLENVKTKGAIPLRHDGNVDEIFAKNSNTIEAIYEVPFLSHSPMEPMNYFADVQKDQCVVAGPTQVPGSVRRLARLITGLPNEKITVKMTRVGGGFGRRLNADYAAEAIVISMKAGKPVQVVWLREDDIRNDFYRPAGMYALKGALDSNGKLAAWYINASTTSRYVYANRSASPHVTEVFPDGFPAGFVPNFRMEYTAVKTNIGTGAWRAPGHNATAFVDQSFVDEMAHLAKKDPVDFRLELLGAEDKILPYRDHGGPTYSTARLKKVIKLAAEKSSWYSVLPKGSFRGFAAHFMFGAYVAEVVQITMTSLTTIKLEKVFCVVDCGQVINRSGALNQIEGGIVDGLSTALYAAVHIINGGAVESNFDDYNMLRIKEAPAIEVTLVDSQENPEGLGEMSLPPIAAALCNAIFAATGKRIRRLPINLGLTKA